GVSGVYAAKVVVIGAGVAGLNAAAIALGMQAEVLLLDKNVSRLRQSDAIYQGHLQTVASNSYEIERAVLDPDLVIGAVLVPAHERDPAVRAGTRQPGLAQGVGSRPGPGARAQHVRRARHVRAGRRGARPGAPAAGVRAALTALERVVRAYLDHLTVERGLA